MKSKLLLLLSLILAGHAHAALLWPRPNMTVDADTLTEITPVRQVEELGNVVRVTYTFPNYDVAPDPLFPGAKILTIPYWGFHETPTEPNVLWRTDFIHIGDSAADCKMVGCDYVDIDLELGGARAPVPDTPDYVAPPCPAIKQKAGFFPSNPVNPKGVCTFKTEYMYAVSLAPIQYDSERKVARVYKKIVYEVSFDTPLKARRMESVLDNEQEYLLDNIVVNKRTHEDLERQKERESRQRMSSLSESPLTRPYLIVTTDEFLPAAKSWRSWKRQCGYTAEICSKTSWTSADEVLDSIKARQAGRTKPPIN